MKRRYLIVIPGISILLMGSTANCSGDPRVEDLESACEGRGGIVALDDGVVVCQDQTVVEISDDE